MNYKKALSIKPDFPDAREYIGGAYIQPAEITAACTGYRYSSNITITGHY